MRTGEYLYTGHTGFPLCIVSKREVPTDAGPKIFELGLSPRQDSKHAGVGVNIGLDYEKHPGDFKVQVLRPRDVPLDYMARAEAFRSVV